MRKSYVWGALLVLAAATLAGCRSASPGPSLTQGREAAVTPASSGVVQTSYQAPPVCTA